MGPINFDGLGSFVIVGVFAIAAAGYGIGKGVEYMVSDDPDIGNDVTVTLYDATVDHVQRDKLTEEDVCEEVSQFLLALSRKFYAVAPDAEKRTNAMMPESSCRRGMWIIESEPYKPKEESSSSPKP